jgi:hypothetical protein
MTELILKRIYNGNSETCCNCKSYYSNNGSNASCDICMYRTKEELMVNTDGKTKENNY